MALREIVRLGHPVLRTAAEEIAGPIAGDEQLQALIDDLLETMVEAGGVGLAAPQVGIARQLFVYGLANPVEGDDPLIPETVVINPMLEPEVGEPVHDWEGCLSIPDLRGLVPRHPAVRVRCLDRRGEPLDFVARGFEARVVQHEFDHLNGLVFLDRMDDLQSLSYGAEWGLYMTDADEPADGD
jgi:peptide deformylase